MNAARAPLNGAWFDAVAGIDPDSLRGDDRRELVLAWERIRRGADAGFTTALGSIAARPCRPDPGDPSCDGGPSCSHDWSREEAQTALVLGPQQAQHLLEESRELTARLPGMLAEVAAGEASMLHARKLASHTIGLAGGMVEAVAAVVAGRAKSVTASAFNRLVVAAVDRLRTPEETLAAHEKSSRRRTGITPLPPMEDGLGGAVLIGPAERIAELFGWARTFTLTNRDPLDPRTVGQRRFDALIDAILGSDDLSFAGLAPRPPDQSQPVAPHPVRPTSGKGRRRSSQGDEPCEPGEPGEPIVRRPRVALTLVLSAETLAGLDSEPAWLEGYGNLPAALARRLAVDPASIQRLLVHPETGQLLDLSPEMRSPNAALSRYVKARDGVCAFPGCGAHADFIDIDHITEFQDGGLSTRVNLHCLCKRHHRAKHAGGWTVERHADATETWTGPTGGSYRTEATSYPTGGSEVRPTGQPQDEPPDDDVDILERPVPPTDDAVASAGSDGRLKTDPYSDDIPF